MSDPQGRRTLTDFVADRPERLFHVGRLDTDTDGLILLTNDGDFAQRMAHPSYEVDKTYVAEVDGVVATATAQAAAAPASRSRTGRSQVSAAKVRSAHGDRSIVELVIHEGRNRIVRRLLDHVGHPVRRLTRTQIGPVRLAGLKQGSLRELDERELGTLLDAAGSDSGRGLGWARRLDQPRSQRVRPRRAGSHPARERHPRPHARPRRRDGARRDGGQRARRSTTSSASSSPRPPTCTPSSRRTPPASSASTTSR